MKKLSIFLLIIIGATLSSSAQNFRINGYTNYVFDDAVDSYYSNSAYFNGTIKGGFQWGAGVEYMLPTQQQKSYGIELSYLHQDTNAPTDYVSDITGQIRHADFDMKLDFIMLGANGYMKVNPKVEPYFGLAAGVGIFNVDNPVSGTGTNATKFSWALKGGANIYATPKVAIKVQAALLSSVQAVGGSLYFGTGGAGAGASGYSSMLQFILGGGLTFNFE
ncbi:outer membrane beta-barrel protein [Solitalea lacus]|uniref:outer membrane beta-barrel protein n=1 Tax=Solitalea lacus TaxID=2911172 RepID=UPI001EDAA8E4|nr:outer membrane beta-barrel protein [Solitalea lacus]UKJ06869.1 outer membrane beta-barrel protein [Solitalea lacus]